MNRFAHEGLVKRVSGGHWEWSPRMQKLAREERIAATPRNQTAGRAATQWRWKARAAACSSRYSGV